MRSEQIGPDLLEQMGYEPRDVNVRQVLGFVFALLGFFVACMVAILFFYSIFIPDWAKLGRQEPIPVNRRVPPYPQVQADPRRDFELYRQAEDRVIEGQGTAMSIEQAIDRMATQNGVAGVRGDSLHQQGNSYPGARTGGTGAGAGAPAQTENTEARGAAAGVPATEEVRQGAH